MSIVEDVPGRTTQTRGEVAAGLLPSVRDAATEAARGATPVSVVAGYGLVTALGDSAATTWEALTRGDYIRTHARAAEVGGDGPRVVRLAIMAAAEAIRQA